MDGRLPLERVDAIAAALRDQLRPIVARVEIVGSIRRRRPFVKDIELLVEPREVAADLFGSKVHDIEAVRAWAGRAGEILKAGDRYIQLARPVEPIPGVIHDASDGPVVRVDVFLCYPPAQWGSLLAIRTGPAELGQAAMIGLRRRGYWHRDGAVWKAERGRAVIVPTPTEREFFQLAGLRHLPPWRRDERLALKPLDQEATA